MIKVTEEGKIQHQNQVILQPIDPREVTVSYATPERKKTAGMNGFASADWIFVSGLMSLLCEMPFVLFNEILNRAAPSHHVWEGSSGGSQGRPTRPQTRKIPEAYSPGVC